jgi:glycosyltransferase involved in cell wall biosynthesis
VNLEVIKLQSKKFLDFKNFSKIFILFQIKQPDIIVSSMLRSMIFCALGKNIKSKLFWLEQNTYTKRTKIQWILLRYLKCRVSKIICISKDVAEYSSRHISNNNKIMVIPNPVWVAASRSEPPIRKNDFIFVGRLVPQKNPDLVLKAFDLFLKTYNKNSHLHIVGDGDLLKSLKIESNRLGILDKCTFHGFIPNYAVYELMKQVKTLVSTSIIEGLAMVRLEALMNGNCIVTTNSGGTEQFFHLNADLGVFLSESNPFDFAGKMQESLGNKYWEDEMINTRKNIASDFSPEKISTKFLLLFKGYSV